MRGSSSSAEAIFLLDARRLLTDLDSFEFVDFSAQLDDRI